MVNGLGERKDDPDSPALLALGKLLPELPCVRFFITSRPVKHIASGTRHPLLKRLASSFDLHNVDPHTARNVIHRLFKHELPGIAETRALVISR